MRFPWSTRHEPEQVREMKREAEEAKRSIVETEPIVREAVKRTNDTFVAVEEQTRRASIEVALLRDLHDGWTRNH